MTSVDTDSSHNAAPQDPHNGAEHQAVRLAVSRTRALERAVFRLAPGVLLLFIALQVISGLQFQPSAVRNRITDYSLAVVAAPFMVAGLALVWTGGRWLLAALWPGKLEIIAHDRALVFRLGPFGTRVYAGDEIDVRYLFEMSGDVDDEDAIYESLQPPDEQMAKHLPRIHHTTTGQRLDQRIMHYACMTESGIAAALRPFIDSHRCDRPTCDPHH